MNPFWSGWAQTFAGFQRNVSSALIVSAVIFAADVFGMIWFPEKMDTIFIFGFIGAILLTLTWFTVAVCRAFFGKQERTKSFRLSDDELSKIRAKLTRGSAWDNPKSRASGIPGGRLMK